MNLKCGFPHTCELIQLLALHWQFTAHAFTITCGSLSAYFNSVRRMSIALCWNNQNRLENKYTFQYLFCVLTFFRHSLPSATAITKFIYSLMFERWERENEKMTTSESPDLYGFYFVDCSVVHVRAILVIVAPSATHYFTLWLTTQLKTMETYFRIVQRKKNR